MSDADVPEVWENWMRIPWRLTFIDTLRRTGNKSLACRQAQISRQQMYRALAEEDDFADAIQDALDEAGDVLEQVAWQRATTGQKLTETKVVVDGQGNVIAEETREATKYSDTLLIFLLKGMRPEKYRDNLSVVHQGKDGKPVVVKVERERSPERLAELLAIAHDLGWRPELTEGTNGKPSGDDAS